MKYELDDSFTKRISLFVVFLPFALAPFFAMILIMHKWRKSKLMGFSRYWAKNIFSVGITVVLTGVCFSPLMHLLLEMDLPLFIQIFANYICTSVIALAIREVDYRNCRKTAKQISANTIIQ